MLDSYFRQTPLAGIGIVLALCVATGLAAAAVRGGWAAPLRVWLYAASLGSYVAVTMLPGAAERHWRWRAPWQVDLAAPRWDAFVTGIDARTLNVWAGVVLGAAAMLLALDLRRAWPVVVAVVAPWLAEWWQALIPSVRDALSGVDVADNLYGMAVGAIAGVVAHLVLVWAERRVGTDNP